MFCPNCGAEVEAKAFCTECGAPLNNPQQEAEPEPEYETAQGANIDKPEPETVYAHATVVDGDAATAQGSFSGSGISGWKTVALFAVLGFVVRWVINGIAAATGTVASIVSVVFFIASIVWALKFYPDFFKNRNLGSMSAEIVSFLNLMFGGLIFGCLWNANLTNGKKGISNVVFVIFQFIEFILVFMIVGAIATAIFAGALAA